jgi:hypothetical protein
MFLFPLDHIMKISFQYTFKEGHNKTMKKTPFWKCLYTKTLGNKATRRTGLKEQLEDILYVTASQGT